MTPVVVSIRDELQAALDLAEPRLAGRTIDLELARLQVQLDPDAFRAELAGLVEAAVAATAADRAITVRVARRGSSARVDVVIDGVDDGDGTTPDDVVGSITVALSAGASNAAAHG